MKQEKEDTLPDAGYKILTLLDGMDLIAEKIGHFGEEYDDDFFNSHDLKKYVEEKWQDTKWEIENGRYKTELQFMKFEEIQPKILFLFYIRKYLETDGPGELMSEKQYSDHYELCASYEPSKYKLGPNYDKYCERHYEAVINHRNNMDCRNSKQFSRSAVDIRDNKCIVTIMNIELLHEFID